MDQISKNDYAIMVRSIETGTGALLSVDDNVFIGVFFTDTYTHNLKKTFKTREEAERCRIEVAELIQRIHAENEEKEEDEDPT